MSERERAAPAEEARSMGYDGTGVTLEDAFKLLSLAPREQLHSLTFKLGRSRPEELVHAMSLMGLGKGREALGKLRALGGGGVAGRLAEMLERRGSLSGAGMQTDPGVDGSIELVGIFQVLAQEKLCDESRRDKAYQVALWACSCQTGNGEAGGLLERLMREVREVCGTEFGATSRGAASCQDGETLSSVTTGLRSYFSLGGGRQSGRGSAAMTIQGSQGTNSSRKEGTSSSSPPSSLRTFPMSLTSYPSHLELSVSPTAMFDVRNATRNVQGPRSPSPQGGCSQELQETTLTDRDSRDGFSGLSPTRTETRERRIQRCPLGEKPSTSASLNAAPPGRPPQAGSAGLNRAKHHAENSGGRPVETPESAEGKASPEQGSAQERPGGASASLSEDRKSESQGKHLKQEDDNEEEEEFYSFVILHSPEDVEVAERLREKLEGLVAGSGAIFNQEFAIPGRHRLTCVDDAISNSAFVILLLSRNFDASMLEFQSNCALTSSLEKLHKLHNVIPLLPSKNRLPRDQIPASLKIFVSLEEGGRGFETKVRKAMTAQRIERQKRVWRQEQSIRAQEERERRMRQDNERKETLLRRTKCVQEEQQRSHMLLQQQKMLEHYKSLLNTQPGQVPAPPGIPPFAPGPGAYCYPMPPYFHPYFMNPEGCPSVGTPFPQPSIHIENASCIMIGNDSQMTVGMGGEKPEEEGAGENSPSKLPE